MKRIRIAIMVLAAVAVSACSGPQTASGNATNDVAPKATQMSQPARAIAQHAFLFQTSILHGLQSMFRVL